MVSYRLTKLIQHAITLRNEHTYVSFLSCLKYGTSTIAYKSIASATETSQASSFYQLYQIDNEIKVEIEKKKNPNS